MSANRSRSGGTRNVCSDQDGAAAAQPHHLPVFEHAEQLGLGLERKLSYLIEEQRSVSSSLERASAKAVSAGKRAALIAEQFALHELLGQGRTVHRDERRLRAGSQPVQFARHQFFTRAAFSEDQDAAWNP